MGEVIDGMCCLIDNPEATLEDLMEHIKGPDFPTCLLYTSGGFPVLLILRTILPGALIGELDVHPGV